MLAVAGHAGEVLAALVAPDDDLIVVESLGRDLSDVLRLGLLEHAQGFVFRDGRVRSVLHIVERQVGALGVRDGDVPGVHLLDAVLELLELLLVAAERRAGLLDEVAHLVVGGEEGNGAKLEEADIKGAVKINIPEIITQKERNAGKVYFYARANDQSKFDIKDYKLTLKSATGKVAPVTFTNLAQTNQEAWWGTWKSSTTDLYTTGVSAEEAWFEADANIADVDLTPSKFEIKKFINLDEIKNDINTAWKNIKAVKDESTDVKIKTIGKEVAQILVNFYSGKMNASALGNDNMSYTPLRLYLSRVAEDGEEYIVKATPLDIFATAVTPLSYNTFYKMEGSAKLDEEKLSDVEKVVKKLGAKMGATKFAEKVNKYLEKSANYIIKKVQNHQLTRAIEPCILFGGAEGIDRLNSGTILEKPGTMEIMMTSPTEELLAPAYLKYIAVVKDGKVLQQATVAGAIQYQELEFPKSGVYQVVLSAVDYHGFVVNKKYDVIVK